MATKAQIKGQVLLLAGTALALATNIANQKAHLESNVVKSIGMDNEIAQAQTLADKLNALAESIEGEPAGVDPAALAAPVEGAVGLAQSPDPTTGETQFATGTGAPLVGENMGTITKGDAPLNGDLTGTAVGSPIEQVEAQISGTASDPDPDPLPDGGKKKK